MEKLAGWLAILAAVIGVVNELSDVLANLYPGWVVAVLAAIAGILILVKG